jgi:hypothetical protein
MRARAQKRSLAIVLLSLVLALCTAGALHAASHTGDANARDHCAACRVVDGTPLAVDDQPSLERALLVWGIAPGAPSSALAAAELTSFPPRGPPAA